MTEVTENQTVEPTELDKLKEYATSKGIEFHPNIGLDKLKERIDAVEREKAPVVEEPVEEQEEEVPAPSTLAAEASQVPTVSAEALAAARAQIEAETNARTVANAQAATAVSEDATETTSQRKFRLRKEATKLVRVNVMNMNPFRKEWEGETYTVGNSQIGTIKRYVPFGVDWHVEQALLNVMQERLCVVYNTRKDKETGQNVTVQRQIKELQIAILPPLTEAELKALGQRQQMAAGTQADED